MVGAGPAARGRLVQGDMSGFALGEPADLAFSPYTSLFHLHTRAQRLGCLACLRRHLSPGGAAGLPKVTVFGGYDSAPFGGESQRMISVAVM